MRATTRIRRTSLTFLAGAAILLAAECGFANSPYSVNVASDLHPRLAPDDAVAISQAYLDAQTPEIAAREMHVEPRITAVWAVSAAEAAGLDGCIPTRADEAVVWVTKGVGDYLNLSNHAWSSSSLRIVGQPDENALICSAPGPQGTLVIDDATGAILGVYPGSPGFPHPSTR